MPAPSTYSSCTQISPPVLSFFFFFNDTATTEIYTLSLHDALPIWPVPTKWGPLDVSASTLQRIAEEQQPMTGADFAEWRVALDRKSTRLNSSHSQISYAVFCLKKKKKE